MEFWNGGVAANLESSAGHSSVKKKKKDKVVKI